MNIIKRKIIAFFLLCLVTLICEHAMAWNDDFTHPKITATAIIASDVSKYLIDNLNLKNGVHSSFGDRSAFDWLQTGAELEDDPACRASNHFHDPLKPWSQAGLTDTWWPVDIWCYLGGQFPPDQISSSLTWATGFLSADPASTDLWVVDFNEWDWDSAREYFHIYLTGRDFQGVLVAPDENSRNEYFSKCLRALGQVLHLLQDASVPAHVRNDFSQGHTDVFPTIKSMPWEWIGNWLEHYVKDEKDAEWFDQSVGGKLNKVSLTNFWDTDNWDGNVPINDDAYLGLAEFANQNFVSEYTIFKNYTFPHESSTNIELFAQGLLEPETVTDESGDTNDVYYFKKITHGKKIDHFLIPSYFTEDMFGVTGGVERTYHLDEKCLKDYAALLIPRAIGYSASLMDYFFRGKLEVSSLPFFTNNKLYAIRLKIKNVTITEEVMRDGQFSVVFRYTPDSGNPDGSDDVFIQSNSVDYGELEYGDAGETELYFYLPPDENIPMERYESVKCTIVFKGVLGNPDGTTNEVDAVIGKAFTLGEIKFNEDWDNGLTGNHNWNHMTQDDFYNVPGNGSTHNEIFTDNKLLKDNIRFSGKDYHQFNHSWLAFEGDGIPITPDTYLQTKIDNIWKTPLSADHTQNLLLNFSINGAPLQLILCPDGHCYWHDELNPWIAYTIDFSNIVFTNIYTFIQDAGIEITGSVYLTSIQISQQIVNYDNTPAATEELQHMEVDFIRIIEQKQLP